MSCVFKCVYLGYCCTNPYTPTHACITDTTTKTKTDGYTLLYIACLGGHLPLVKYLLNERQADKDEKIKNGATPLTAATEAGHEAVAKYLESFDVANIDNSRHLPIAEE